MKKVILLFVICFCWLNLVVPVKACINIAPHTPQVASTTREQVQEIKLYPNPTTGKLFLSLTGFKEKRIELQVINVIGNVVLQDKFYETEDQTIKVLELSKFNKGLYYVKLEAEKYSEMHKIFLN